MQPGPVISARVAVAPTGMLRRQGLPLRLGPSSLAAMPPLPGSPVGFSALTARLDSCRILVKDSSVMFVPFMAYATSVCAIHSYLCVSASVTDVVCFFEYEKVSIGERESRWRLWSCRYGPGENGAMRFTATHRRITCGSAEACRSCFHNHSRRWSNRPDMPSSRHSSHRCPERTRAVHWPRRQPMPVPEYRRHESE